MKTYDEWDNIQNHLDLIELLQLIRTAMHSGTATLKSASSYIEAKTALITFRQGKKTSKTIEAVLIYLDTVEVIRDNKSYYMLL